MGITTTSAAARPTGAVPGNGVAVFELVGGTVGLDAAAAENCAGMATESIAAKTATGKIVLFMLASWNELVSELRDPQS
jgi:hypothetical protein